MADAGVDYDDVVHQLEVDGLATFEASWTALAETLDRKLTATARHGNTTEEPG